MKKQTFLIFLIFSMTTCRTSCFTNKQVLEISSPNNNIQAKFLLSPEGQPGYSVRYIDKLVIDDSYFGFDFKTVPSMENGFIITQHKKRNFSETWETILGEQRIVENSYNELKIELMESDHLKRQMNIVFRVYDDGLGFRFEFPDQENLKDVVIMDENTEFNLTGDHTTWWIPGDWDSYEHLYNTTKLSEIDAISKRNHSSLAQTYIPENAVNTPVTLKTDDGLYISFHEANLTNFSGITLKVNTETYSFTSELVGSADGSKVKISTPFVTPWRTIQIAEKAGDLIESHLIVNLNEPNRLKDTGWIKPMKYVGIWWEMHIGKSTWDMASGRHGATTENAKKYIDFAADNNIDGVLIEGWNTGWEKWIGFDDREGVFDFITPYEDYDLDEVVRYAKAKDVKIIMHHETSAAPRTYEAQLDTAFALCKMYDINAVKTGYVGKIIPKGEYHHGQWMVNHYQKVLEKAADYEIMVNIHEPIKDTGIRRTYPNMISREGLRGQEFNAWSEGGNPPEHLTIVPFTRMLAGPIDFTPGIFDIKLADYKPNNQINTTLAHQLALYVVVYSPIQMAADLPENYVEHLAFQFIRDVGLNWEESHVLDGEIGDFVVLARKERETDNWFIGAVTDENDRNIEIDFEFLDDGKQYVATIYADAKNAHWNKNPTAIDIYKRNVNKNDRLLLKLAEGGGAAISLRPAD
ncbi:glycoside hydrolase family 97 protein [bacterium]|nr:glycoside hydrolase family 97 protein [bacterium]